MEMNSPPAGAIIPFIYDSLRIAGPSRAVSHDGDRRRTNILKSTVLNIILSNPALHYI